MRHPKLPHNMKKFVILLFLAGAAFIFWMDQSHDAKAKPRNEKALLRAITTTGSQTATTHFLCPSGKSPFTTIVFMKRQGARFEVAQHSLWTSMTDMPAGEYAILFAETAKYKVPKKKPEYFQLRGGSIYTLDIVTNVGTLTGYAISPNATRIPSPMVRVKIVAF